MHQVCQRKKGRGESLLSPHTHRGRGFRETHFLSWRLVYLAALKIYPKHTCKGVFSCVGAKSSPCPMSSSFSSTLKTWPTAPWPGSCPHVLLTPVITFANHNLPSQRQSRSFKYCFPSIFQENEKHWTNLKAITNHLDLEDSGPFLLSKYCRYQAKVTWLKVWNNQTS